MYGKLHTVAGNFCGVKNFVLLESGSLHCILVNLTYIKIS